MVDFTVGWLEIMNPFAPPPPPQFPVWFLRSLV